MNCLKFIWWTKTAYSYYKVVIDGTGYYAFDEPTSALDPEMVVEVQDIMNELAMEGMTMVVVSHEVSFISKFATRIIYLEDGKIIEDGTFEDLRKSDNEK